MCGICGIVSFDHQVVASDALHRACHLMRHRGPDHAGVWMDRANRAGLGAVRLAVLDPSPAGNQPMHDTSGRYHLAFNGEIYNYRELRAELSEAGERFATGADTEVVLTACARWGTDALARFNGMWAFIFFDSETRSGFLARDRFGIKPLCYVADKRRLCLASELRALTILAPDYHVANPDAVVEHLQFGYIAQPATIYKGVRKLEPGHYATFDRDGLAVPTRFYSPSPRPIVDGGRAYEDSCRALRRALGDAIVARRVSDVPIGAFLSGGLDSSIIAYHLAEASGRPVQTFAVGFEGQPGYDETRYARRIAHQLATDHHELILTSRDVLDAIPAVLNHLGEPLGDSSIIPTALLSRFARQRVTVALSGDGGDELFGGYWRYLGHASLQAYLRLPLVIRRGVVEPSLRVLGASKSSAIGNRVRQFHKLLRGQGGDALQRHIAWSRIMSPEAEIVLRHRERASDQAQRIWQRALALTDHIDGHDALLQVLLFDLQHQLPADMLQKVDLASMMHSLEVRVPFLDPGVVEIALSMPSTDKIDRGLRKRVLVDTYRGRLPDEVLDRAKMGFEVPVGEFLRGPLRELFCDTVTREAVEGFGLLSYEGVTAVYRDHCARRGEHADILFALLSLCWWHRGPSLAGLTTAPATA